MVFPTRIGRQLVVFSTRRRWQLVVFSAHLRQRFVVDKPRLLVDKLPLPVVEQSPRPGQPLAAGALTQPRALTRPQPLA